MNGLYKRQMTKYLLFSVCSISINIMLDNLFQDFKAYLIDHHYGMLTETSLAENLTQLISCCNDESDKTLKTMKDILLMMKTYFEQKKREIYAHHEGMTLAIHNVKTFEEFKENFDKVKFYNWIKMVLATSDLKSSSSAIWHSLSDEDFDYIFDNVTMNENSVPKRERKYYCSQHRLPWCLTFQIPCYFCLCDSCEKLPDQYRQSNDNAQCTFCKLPIEEEYEDEESYDDDDDSAFI